MDASPSLFPVPQAGPLWYRRQPHAEMAGIVAGITGYREDGHGLRGSVEMASFVVPLVISFGEPFSIALGRPPREGEHWSSFAAGLYAGHVVIDSSGGAECIQVDFTPLGARRFFGLPMSELVGRMVAFDELGDREMMELRDRLANTASWRRRFELVEDFVLTRVRRGSAPDQAVRHAYAYIMKRGGDVRISRLAREINWSRKHLAERFRTQIGLSPKVIARMARFHHALDLARDTREIDWADLAAACGYADQAHLTREFSQFAGTTPTRWRAAPRAPIR